MDKIKDLSLSSFSHSLLIHITGNTEVMSNDKFSHTVTMFRCTLYFLNEESYCNMMMNETPPFSGVF